MLTRPPLLFALKGTECYASRVAQRLGCQLARHEERDYEDGEHKCRPLDPVSGRDVVVFHSLYGEGQQSANDKLCRLLFFCGALKDADARRVQVVAPYLCYGRKDRRSQPQDPTITRYVAAFFEASGVDRLIALDVHNPAAFDNAFRIPAWNLQCSELFAGHFAGLVGDAEVVAVSPDSGGTKRAEQFRQALERQLGRSVGSALMEKHRNHATLTGTLLIGEVSGKTAIVFDDLISTGETLTHAGLACQKAGAVRLFAAATHGLFTAGSRLFDPPLFEHIAITDSVPPFRLPPDCVTRHLQVLDSTALIATLLAESGAFDHV
ncbi:ribose-phosphate diphosphokinase [Pseudomonas fluorescens]|jgi:ribose-phosphate pyrophosphokinase|uniref:ribose-phosphate diphosphokinase n=1 Tax=Pseudomonas fluorescens TaxID=294 RepID=UPI002ACA1B88|nr:ribose-phosphate diphosphokinase [Pseudomonas fluorescens]MDZ5436368.1 ribose-phosphate diphosphokinase [Pseudomonas fluorescens]